MRRPVTSGIVAALVIGVGASWLTGGPDRQGVTSVVGAPHCPGRIPRTPPPREGLTEHLVPIMAKFPVGPTGATVCRYPSLRTGRGAVVHGAVLDAARTAEVAGWLDVGSLDAGSLDAGAERTPPASGTCSAQDDGKRLVLTFRYPAGPAVQVIIIRSTGCALAANGVRVESITADVASRIAAFVPQT